MAKHKATLIDGLHGANDIIEQALRFYFRNASVTIWEKNINTEDDKKSVSQLNSKMVAGLRFGIYLK